MGERLGERVSRGECGNCVSAFDKKMSKVSRGGVGDGITCVLFDVVVTLLFYHEHRKLNM